MMEKAIKQRLLGGLVLVAGAALFLPVLLDGSGASLTIPPMPVAPEVATVEDMAPRLDQKVAAADQEVEAAHAGRDAAPADAVNADAGAATGATTETGSDVTPDAAALAAEGGVAAAVPARAPAPEKPVVIARPVPEKAVVAAKPPAAVPEKAVVAAKPPVTAPDKAVAAGKLPASVPEKPVVTAKPVPEKAVAAAKTPAATPEKAVASAWVVQVANLSSREKAQTLLQQLRRKGYPAVLNQQGGNWKVMVGPELSREVALAMKNRLNADGDINVDDAWVQAYKP